MEVTSLRNYGKDLLTIRRQSPPPWSLRLKLFPAWFRFHWSLLVALGLRRMLAFPLRVHREAEALRQRDWSAVLANKLSPADLTEVVREIALAKVLADQLGLRKAAHLRHRYMQHAKYPLFEITFASPQTFKECGEFFQAFKSYYLAYLAAMRQAGLIDAEIKEDSDNVLQVNVTYCAWAEVAAAVGNPRYCYYAVCYADEVYFPRLCESGGLRFERSGTLGQAEPCCDHRFVKALPKETQPSNREYIV